VCFAHAQNTLDLSQYCTRVILCDSVEISLYTPTMFGFRISHLEKDRFDLKYAIPFAIGKHESWKPVVHQQKRDGDVDIIETTALQIRVTRTTLTRTVWTKDGKKQICPSEGPIYGMFRDGYTVFDNASAFHEVNNNSRYSHWFYNPKTRNYVDVYLEEDLIQDEYFIYGPEYEKIFAQFNELVGPEPLLPKKGYGFFQTQHLKCEGTQEKLLEVAREFRKRGIPCDNLIVDLEWGDGCDGNTEVKWGSRLDWNPNYMRPLSPKQMIDSLHAMHYSVMLIHHNAPNFANRKHQGWTECVYDDTLWWRKLKEKLAIGVDGSWQDTRKNDITDAVIWQGLQDYFGPSHRVYFLGCRKMMSLNPWDDYYCGYPVNEMIGSRRYPFAWTEDVSNSWNELRFQINAITDTHGSLKGITYLTSDAIGADWRIQARWNQFGDFSTVSRSHNPKPWSGTISAQGFAEKIRITGHDTLCTAREEITSDDPNRPTAEESIRKHRRLRYRLLPYVYSYAHINYQTGMPICRPMLLAFPNDHRCNGDQWPYQYMFGEWILVAPVYGDFNTMEIYLPAGHKWIDYWSGEVFQGGGIINYDTRDINTLPLFVKAGAILPMGKERQWIDTSVPDDSLWLDVYPAARSTFALFEDDGTSISYQQGAYAKTILNGERDSTGRVSFTVGKSIGDYADKGSKRHYVVRVNLVPALPSSVTYNGASLPEGRESREGSGWRYNREKKVVELWFDQKVNQEGIITIE